MPAKIRGRVVRGAGEGRTTGYPTANLELDSGCPCPAPGIYACWVHHAVKRYAGALVSGVHWEKQQPRVEIHILDFNDDLYGEELEVEIIDRVRDIEQFTDAAALRQRIAQDIADVSKLLGL